MVLSLKQGSARSYKIKLASGRVLGPIDIERIRLLILKNQVIGVEVAREYPQGDWKDINQIHEIAELLIARAGGKLKETPGTPDLFGSTQVFGSRISAPLPEPPQGDPQGNSEGDHNAEDQERTIIQPRPSFQDHQEPDDDRTRVATKLELTPSVLLEGPTSSVELESGLPTRSLAHEETVVFQRSSDSLKLPGKRPKSLAEILKGLAVALVLGALGYNLFLAEPTKPIVLRNEPIRPQLPEYIQGKSDPKTSTKIYEEAMKYYLADTVVGYRIAANRLREAAAYDVGNVKALAMLASSYLNLIDSSNKDEDYFSVISKLIDMSRAKNVDLPETVIADVELYLVANKPEAAQNRIIDYTKAHQNFGLEMFYYLALTFYFRGDPSSAVKYLGQFPDNKAFSAKVFYLRGLIAEKLNDTESAMSAYLKGIQFNKDHAKSHLKVAMLLNKQGKLKESGPYLEFLVNHTNLLSPIDAAMAYYQHCQLAELNQKWDFALGDIERAVKLDPDNHDFLLEFYTLRAKAGDSPQAAEKQARMYYFLSEGEKLIQQGKYQEALVPLLQARQSYDESYVPLVKIGDMFNYLHDVENAKANYRLATERAPNNVQVWSKYVDTLIQSYEWDEAQKGMDKFRNLPVGQSAIDKAAADLYQKQGRYVEAQTFYRKAMKRDSIDPAVYIAYAKSLMSTRNFKDAPFFFALALRHDPLNVDAVINTAKCVAETESPDRAISMLQDKLQGGSEKRAEYLAAIAELQIQKGSWDQAQKNVEQAMQADPNNAYPWKLQAEIYMNQEGVQKDAMDKALFAYKSYSERNTSDPTGYLERYRIFLKKAEFEKAKEELNRIYEIYPKYPGLHFYLGSLYSVQGNHKVAGEEFKRELANNPGNIQAIVAFGKELLENGQAQEALKQFTQAMQLMPNSSDARQNAGWANFRLKNYVAAISLLRSAVSMDKGNPILFKRLGIIYKETGDLGSACVSFRKYLEMEPDASDKAEYASCF